MNEYDDIDFNDYGPPEEIVIQKPAPKSESKKQVKSNLPSDDIDFADYGVGSQEESGLIGREARLKKQAGIYATEEKTPEQIRNMSLEEKRNYAQELKTEREYLGSKQFTKGVASGATLGASEYIPGLEIEDKTAMSSFGSLVGESLPLVQGMKLANKAIQGIPKAYKWGTRAAKTAAAFTVGSGLEAAKEAIKGEGFDPLAIGLHGAVFGAADIVIRSAIRYVPGVYNWIKGLKPSQRAEFLVEGAIPSDLNPTQYKLYQDKIHPALQDIAKEEFVAASEKATQEAEALYQKELAQTITDHEEYLYNLAKDKKLDQAAFEKAEVQFKFEQKNKIAKHEAEMEAIEAANQEAKAAFEEQNSEWQKTVRRQNIVDNAIKNVPKTPETPSEDLYGRANPDYFRTKDKKVLAFRGAKQEGKNLVNNPPIPPPAESLKDKVGSIVSPKKIENPTNAGKRNIAAVRASDEADYAVTREWYKYAKEQNKGISTEQPQLVNDLTNIINELSQIGHPSAPQKQAIKAAEDIFSKLHTHDEFGLINGFREMSNENLIKQAQALRYYKDYEFAHGNTGAIFNPLIEALENATERAAISAGNEAAMEANQIARNEYRKWAEVYDNEFIQAYRSKDADPTKLFDKSLNIDDYNKLDRVLSRTNAGQQISRETRRALVEKELKPFFKDRGKVNPEEFNDTLNRLKPILEEGEEQAIRESFAQERKTLGKQAKKIELPKEPKEPKLKSIDRVDNITYFKPPKPRAQEITEVKLPVKKEVKPTPEMKAAAKKMKRTPEDIMKESDTPTGLRNLREELSKKEHGKELFEEIGQYKVKEILHGGNVKQKFTGAELYKRINKGKNFDLLSEIMGEDAALDLLESAAAIGDTRMTVNALKKYAKKVGTVKAALMFGIL